MIPKCAKKYLTLPTHKLSHTTWAVNIQIVFAPIYRRKLFYDSKRLETGHFLREICRWKGIEILEAEICVDHIDMLLEIPPNYNVSSVMRFLKGKSSLIIYDR